jgi:hypothetical protein
MDFEFKREWSLQDRTMWSNRNCDRRTLALPAALGWSEQWPTLSMKSGKRSRRCCNLSGGISASRSTTTLRRSAAGAAGFDIWKVTCAPLSHRGTVAIPIGRKAAPSRI